MRRRMKIALVAAGMAAPALVLVATSMTAGPALAELPIGKAAPDFRLNDVNGRAVSLSDFGGKTVVLEWSNPECPSVKKHYESGNMQKTQAVAAADGVVWLTINSGAEGKQGHMTPAEAKAFTASQQSRRTAYLLDPKGGSGGAMAPGRLRICTSSTGAGPWYIMVGSTTSRRKTKRTFKTPGTMSSPPLAS